MLVVTIQATEWRANRSSRQKAPRDLVSPEVSSWQWWRWWFVKDEAGGSSQRTTAPTSWGSTTGPYPALGYRPPGCHHARLSFLFGPSPIIDRRGHRSGPGLGPFHLGWHRASPPVVLGSNSIHYYWTARDKLNAGGFGGGGGCGSGGLDAVYLRVRWGRGAGWDGGSSNDSPARHPP